MDHNSLVKSTNGSKLDTFKLERLRLRYMTKNGLILPPLELTSQGQVYIASLKTSTIYELSHERTIITILEMLEI